MNQFLFWLIALIAGFAIYGSTGLVVGEWTNGNICPKILGIPACYLVWICFVGATISHLIPLPNGNRIFFFLIGMVTLVASTGTLGELTETVKCPRTAGGTPMCFISLTICLSLLLSKFLLLKRLSAKNNIV